MMFDKAYHAILFCKINKIKMMREELGRRFGDEDMKLMLESVTSNRVVGTCHAILRPRAFHDTVLKMLTVRCEDDDCFSRRHFINDDLVWQAAQLPLHCRTTLGTYKPQDQLGFHPGKNRI